MLRRINGGEETTPPIIVEEMTDPVELAKAHVQYARLKKNREWFQNQASEVYGLHRGKCVAIAGQELFVGDTSAEAIALARTAHPDDDGMFMLIIRRERGGMIYVHRTPYFLCARSRFSQASRERKRLE